MNIEGRYTLMTVGFSRCIYQDPLIRMLRLAAFEIFMNHTCIFLSHESCSQLCAGFYARSINEGHYVEK